MRLKTKSLAAAANKWDVRINSIHPGFTWTPMAQESVKRIANQTRAGIAGLHPFGRIREPDEIAAAILFLATDEASFVASSGLTVDGGYAAI